MSRHDLEGLFWQDVERVSTRGVGGKKVEASRPMAPIPETGWRTPTAFPDLSGATIICIDCETYDPDLLTDGPGVRRDGYIVGVSVGVPDGGRWYFPMRHTVCPEQNMDPEMVLKWARVELCRPNQPKCGANLMYDLDYLSAAGVNVTGPFIDVQIAEPLIDENARSYSLDTISNKYLGEGKKDDALYRWAYLSYGGKEGRSQAGNIWRSPPSLVGPYAEGDVDLPLRIWEHQKKIIEAEGLAEVFSIESRLIPLLLAMRQRGVRIDVEAAGRAFEMLSDKITEAEKSLGGIDIYSGQDIARYCKKEGIEYQLTDAGNPSFTANWLERHANPRIKMISEARKYYKARDTFVKGYILDSHIKGRIHAQFNQLRSEDGGAVSGRFSSSLPNLQNIPARDEMVGPMMRSMFLPEEGETWAKFDWSQIEFRFLCHYGRGQGADVARSMYINDPTTDFHQMAAELTGIDRKPAKNINFGLVYGMGEKTMADGLGRSLADVKPMFETYHARLPFIKHTFSEVSKMAEKRGYIRTMLGRRRRFDLYEPVKWTENAIALPLEAATARWGNVRRAATHKGLNALLQGSAADAMKIAMVRMWEDGICSPSELGALLMTVHDEGDFSIPPDKMELLAEVKHIMETCITLRVPVIAELEVGPNWGSLK